MYIDSSACVRVKGGETGLHTVPLAFQCIYGCSDERGETGDGKEGSEIHGRGERVAGFLYADNLVLCGESEEDLRVMVGWFV